MSNNVECHYNVVQYNMIFACIMAVMETVHKSDYTHKRHPIPRPRGELWGQGSHMLAQFFSPENNPEILLFSTIPWGAWQIPWDFPDFPWKCHFQSFPECMETLGVSVVRIWDKTDVRTAPHCTWFEPITEILPHAWLVTVSHMILLAAGPHTGLLRHVAFIVTGYYPSISQNCKITRIWFSILIMYITGMCMPTFWLNMPNGWWVRRD